MKRDYKLSSILIIQLISAIVAMLITRLFIGNISFRDGYMATRGLSSTLARILTSVLKALTGFIIARGLIKNRNGSVGEYLDHINAFNIKSFAVIFIIQLLLLTIMPLLIALFSPLLLSAFLTSSELSFVPIIMFIAIALLIVGIISVFSFYSYFVVADYGNEYSFGELFSKTFRTGKDLLKPTLIVFIKFIILPIIIFMIILAITISGASGNLLVSGISVTLMTLAMIAFAIYFIIASALLYGEISKLYLSYRNLSSDTYAIYE